MGFVQKVKRKISPIAENQSPQSQLILLELKVERTEGIQRVRFDMVSDAKNLEATEELIDLAALLADIPSTFDNRRYTILEAFPYVVVEKVKDAFRFLVAKLFLDVLSYLATLNGYAGFLILQLRFKVQSLKATTEFDFLMSLPSTSHHPRVPAKYIQLPSAFYPTC